MVYILEANKLSIENLEVLKLTAKDKVVIVGSSKNLVSLEICAMLSELKIKPDFQIADYSPKNAIVLGSLYGYLIAKYEKESITILSDNDYSMLPAKNLTCVNTLIPKTKGRMIPAQKVKMEPKVDEVKEEKKESPVAAGAKSGSTTAKVSRVRLKDLSNESILAKYKGLEPYAERITKIGSDMLKQAIGGASDVESFKFKLQMCFGDDGEGIWKVLKKDFDKLKAML